MGTLTTTALRADPRRRDAIDTIDPTRPAWTLVWIDSRQATICHWRAGQAHYERVHSDVPAHHRSTGHVRHDPTTRHGGGGPPQTAGEPRRLEHLARFLDQVVARIPDHEDVAILGPGTVRQHLERILCERDARRSTARAIASRAAGPLTDRQLADRLRRLVGAAPIRGRTSAPGT